MNKVRPTIGNNIGGNMVRQTIRVRIEKAFDYAKAKFKQFERKEWNEMRSYGLGIGSLKIWARDDSQKLKTVHTRAHLL